MNILPHGPAWDVDLQAEQPVIGDSLPFREQRLNIRAAAHWGCSDIHLGRYGDLCLTFRHNDSNQTAELNIRPGDDAAPRLGSALVWLVARQGDRCYGTPEEQARQRAAAADLLDRLEGAIAGARADLDRTEEEVAQ